MNQRYEELDSIRGLAALTVVFSHFFLSVPNFFLTNKLNATPLRIFWAGHEAVILFFLLSGLVLALPYTRSKKPLYKPYIIKRTCRIYLPYLFSLILGLASFSLVPRRDVSVSVWFDSLWKDPFQLRDLLSQILFLGEYKSTMNFVTWSLIHEMRISIIFPLLMIIVMKFNWKTNVVIGIVFSVLYHYSDVYLNLIGHVDHYDSGFPRTIHYSSIFILGALIAKNLTFLKTIWIKQNRLIKTLILLLGVLSYTYRFWFMPNFNYAHLMIVEDWAIAFGGIIFIICGISSSTVSNLLLLKPIHFLGKISYSLYLLHGIVLLAVVHSLQETLPLYFVLLLALLASFLVAIISYFFVEKPSINLGKKLTLKYSHFVVERNKKAV